MQSARPRAGRLPAAATLGKGALEAGTTRPNHVVLPGAALRGIADDTDDTLPAHAQIGGIGPGFSTKMWTAGGFVDKSVDTPLTPP
jgi:hypothetical protein